MTRPARLAVSGEALAPVAAGDEPIVYLILLTSLVALGFAALFAKEVLAAGQGTRLRVEAEGGDARDALEKIEQLIRERFGESE